MVALHTVHVARPALRPVSFAGHTHPAAPVKQARELNGAARFCDEAIENWYQKNRFVKWLKKVLNIRCGLYDNGISPYHCSQIVRMKIRKDGALKGVLWGYGRIMWCNPLTFRFKALQKYFRVP